MADMKVVDDDHAEILRHMLGAGLHIPKRSHGYRSGYCVGIGSDAYGTLIEMERIGLVKAGVKINLNLDQYFHATIEGCKAIGLSKAAIKRAFEK